MYLLVVLLLTTIFLGFVYRQFKKTKNAKIERKPLFMQDLQHSKELLKDSISIAINNSEKLNDIKKKSNYLKECSL
uniref:Uncharacterized protein n=1 Tax=viral metagenome TaxID=1070528 RepID=A0A6C0EEB7_9ZZZZ